MERIWKDIKSHKGYQVSSDGLVKSVARTVIRTDGKPYPIKEKIRKTNKNNSGYLKVELCINGKSKTKYVHRLVAEAFCKKQTNHSEVNHKNGIKTDNNMSNLEWCHKSENVLHRYRVLKK